MVPLPRAWTVICLLIPVFMLRKFGANYSDNMNFPTDTGNCQHDWDPLKLYRKMHEISFSFSFSRKTATMLNPQIFHDLLAFYRLCAKERKSLVLSPTLSAKRRCCFDSPKPQMHLSCIKPSQTTDTN